MITRIRLSEFSEVPANIDEFIKKPLLIIIVRIQMIAAAIPPARMVPEELMVAEKRSPNIPMIEFQ